MLAFVGSAPTKKKRNSAFVVGSRWIVEPSPSMVMSEAIAGMAAAPYHEVCEPPAV